MINLRQIGMVTAMANVSADYFNGGIERMDHATSIAVCNGIGERLRDIMRPGAGHLPPRLQQLMEQLQQIDESPSIVPQMHPVTRTR
jgi:hypothetical protein